MSRIEWLVLFLVFVAYVLIGGVVFQEIEAQAEADKNQQAALELRAIQALVSRELRDGSPGRDEVLAKLSELCGKNLLAPLNETEEAPDEEAPQHWDFYNSFFFAITVVSTIGYGNLSPTTTGSRMFCIAYALIGIPLNGILLAGLGEYFSRTFLRAHHRYREAPEVESRCALLLKVGQYLAAGICIFILLPAVIFAVAENWSYEESVYYAFITLSTIGFGDYVAGYMTTYSTWKQAPSLLAVYRTFIVLWIVFGLGYLAMILSFITRAMRSSRIRRLEQRVAKRFKSTHARLWHGASRDLRYLRRVLNELYMLKFKVRLQQRAGLARRPATRMPSLVVNQSKRFSSLPAAVDSFSDCNLDTDLWYLQPVYRARPSLAPAPMRGRSLSLPVLFPSAAQDVSLTKRSMSEACLDMIDRGATFAAAPRRVDTSELLATVVDALVASAAASEADMEEEEEEDLGYHGFADAEILATEEQPPVRSRASSIAPSLRSRLRSRAGSIASHLGGDHRAPRSRGSVGSPVSLRRALAMRNAAAAAAAGEPPGYESGSSSPKRFERRAPLRDPWARRRSDGAVVLPSRLRAASLAPQPQTASAAMQQLDASTLGDLLRALHSLHSKVEPAPLRENGAVVQEDKTPAQSSPRAPHKLAQRLLSRLDSHTDVEAGIPEEPESPVRDTLRLERERGPPPSRVARDSSGPPARVARDSDSEDSEVNTRL